MTSMRDEFAFQDLTERVSTLEVLASQNVGEILQLKARVEFLEKELTVQAEIYVKLNQTVNKLSLTVSQLEQFQELKNAKVANSIS